MGQAGRRRSEEFRAAAVVPRIEQAYRWSMAKETSKEFQQVTFL